MYSSIFSDTSDMNTAKGPTVRCPFSIFCPLVFLFSMTLSRRKKILQKEFAGHQRYLRIFPQRIIKNLNFIFFGLAKKM